MLFLLWLVFNLITFYSECEEFMHIEKWRRNGGKEEVLSKLMGFTSRQMCRGPGDKALPHTQTQSAFWEIITATQANCHKKSCFETPSTYRTVNNSYCFEIKISTDSAIHFKTLKSQWFLVCSNESWLSHDLNFNT